MHIRICKPGSFDFVADELDDVLRTHCTVSARMKIVTYGLHTYLHTHVVGNHTLHITRIPKMLPSEILTCQHSKVRMLHIAQNRVSSSHIPT